jgi:hypothetical protein
VRVSHTILDHVAGIEIQPGQIATITARPQSTVIELCSAFFSMAYGAAFAIRELRIGCRSIMRGCARVPLRNGLMFERQELEELFLLEPILVAMDFSIDVENTGRIPSCFVAHWECAYEASDPYVAAPSVSPQQMAEAHLERMRGRIDDPPPSSAPPQQIADSILERMRARQVEIDARVMELEALPPSPEDKSKICLSHLGRIPARERPIERWTKTPAGFGWDPGEG